MASLLDSINTITKVFYQWADWYGDSFTLSRREAKKLIQEEFGEAVEGLWDSQALDLISEHLENKEEGLFDFNNYLDLIFCVARACCNCPEGRESRLPRGEDTVTPWGEERVGRRTEEGANARRRRDSTQAALRPTEFPREVSERRDRVPRETAAGTRDLSNDHGRSHLVQDCRHLEADYETRYREDRSTGAVGDRQTSLEHQPQWDERSSRDLREREESGRGCPSRPFQFLEGDEREQYSQVCTRRRDDLNMETYYNSERRGRDAEQGRSREPRTTPRESLPRGEEPFEDLERESGNLRAPIPYSEPREGERRAPPQAPVMGNGDRRSQRYSESELPEEAYARRTSEARGRTPSEEGQRVERLSKAQSPQRVDERRRSHAQEAGLREGSSRQLPCCDARPSERDAFSTRSLRRGPARRDDGPDRRRAHETEPIEGASGRADRSQVREPEPRGDGQRQPCREPRSLGRDGERRRVQPLAPSLREDVPRHHHQQQYRERGSLEGRRQPRGMQHAEREPREDGRASLPRERVQGRQRYSESEDLGGQRGRRRPQLYEAHARDGEGRAEIASQH